VSGFGDRFRAAFLAVLQGRYGRSVFGRVWLASPVVLVATLAIALHFLVGASEQLSVLSLVLGIVLWNFFAGATSEGVGGIPARRALLHSGDGAALVLVTATVGVHVLELVLGLGTFVGCQVALGRPPQVVAWDAVVPLLMLVVLALGTSLVMVVVRARLGDADHAWKLLLGIGFWVTPVVYEIHIVPERLRPFVELNPLARIIEEVRGAMLHAVAPDPRHVLVTACVALVTLAVGRAVAIRSAALIAERA
jgi:ABC-type polysaccharide/polyol phosphate export permease